MTNKKLYLGGDILTYGAQLQRSKEKEELLKLGLDLYVPQDNDDINDKANADQENLAERIVYQDTKALLESDIIILDAHENGKGSLVELGQLSGMKDLSNKTLNLIDDLIELDLPSDRILNEVLKLMLETYNKEIYIHNTDIRRENSQPQIGDRREYAPNQYVYGTALKLTNNKGFYEWHEIIDNLKEGK